MNTAVVLRWILASALMGCTVTTAFANGAGAFVRGLMNMVMKGAEPSEKQYLGPSLYKSFARLTSNKACTEVPGLGAELISGQDQDFKSFSVTVIKDNNKVGVVRVRFTNFGRPQDNTLQLQKIGGAWKISDVCATGESDKNMCYRAEVANWKC